jgi:acetylornithine deacetylase/succinyl-diaminopimelate desuccinylase-like protein
VSRGAEGALDAARVERALTPDEVVGLARRLVATPSYAAAHGWEAGVAAVLEEVLGAAGLQVRRQPVVAGRENVLAVLPGVREGPPLLVLNGHMDTVPPPVDAPRPPLAAEVAEGRLWGRGAADMKGGLAALAGALLALHRAGVQPPRPIVLAAVVAEESGNLGTAALVRAGAAWWSAASLPEEGVAARRVGTTASPRAGARGGASSGGRPPRQGAVPVSYAVVAEPTGLDLVTAHKGVDRYRITVCGRAAHSSTPDRGVNAIVRAARLIVALEERLIPARDDPPHPLLGRPSYSIGTIQGGVSRNVVPDRCVFQIEKRYLPGDSPARIRAALERLATEVLGPGAAVVEREPEFETIPHPPLAVAADHPLVRAASAAVAEVRGRAPALVGLPGFTDAALLQAAGIPAVVCGPGDLTAAHTDDEAVPVDDLWAAARIYIRLALRVIAAAG